MRRNIRNHCTRLLLCLGLGLVGGTGCKKAEEILVVTKKLPDATQTGEGTFGCLVDGELWLPNDKTSLLPADYGIRTNSFPIGAPVFIIEANGMRDNRKISHFDISVRSTGAIVPGVYTLGNGFAATATYGTESYSTANAGSGTMTITKLEPRTTTVNGITTRASIVSGTFQFVAKDGNGKSIAVTDGRFDLQAWQ